MAKYNIVVYLNPRRGTVADICAVGIQNQSRLISEFFGHSQLCLNGFSMYMVIMYGYHNTGWIDSLSLLIQI